MVAEKEGGPAAEAGGPAGMIAQGASPAHCSVRAPTFLPLEGTNLSSPRVHVAVLRPMHDAIVMQGPLLPLQYDQNEPPLEDESPWVWGAGMGVGVVH